MENMFVSRLHRVGPGIAKSLVAAGLVYPAEIRKASEGDLRKALKGRGVNERVAAVRRAYPKRK